MLEDFKEHKKVARIKDHWLKLVGEELVIGLEVGTTLDCGILKEVELHVSSETSNIEYTSYLLKVSRERNHLLLELVEEIEATCGKVNGYLVAKIPFRCLNASQEVKLNVSMSYNLSSCTRRLHSPITPLTVQPLDFCSESLAPSFNSPFPISSFASVMLTGIREKIIISTELGSLTHLPDVLPQLNFRRISSVDSFLLDIPQNPLHLSIISISQVSSKRTEAYLYAKDYSYLTLLVRMLRNILPAD